MAGSMMQNAAILWHVSLLVEPANHGLAHAAVATVPRVVHLRPADEVREGGLS